MRMNLFIKGFMTFWFTFVILFCLMVPFLHFDMPFCFIPYIMLVFGIVLAVLPNRIETRKAKEKLWILYKTAPSFLGKWSNSFCKQQFLLNFPLCTC